jgi:hypothetical protein
METLGRDIALSPVAFAITSNSSLLHTSSSKSTAVQARAAIKIQAVGRMYVAGKRVAALRRQKMFENRRRLQRRSAVQIQRIARGFIGRRRIKRILLGSEVPLSLNEGVKWARPHRMDGTASPAQVTNLSSEGHVEKIQSHQSRVSQEAETKRLQEEKQALEAALIAQRIVMSNHVASVKAARELQERERVALEQQLHTKLQSELSRMQADEAQRIATAAAKQAESIIASQFQVGSRIEVRVRDGSLPSGCYMPAVVVKCRPENKFDVRYEATGMIARYVPVSEIKLHVLMALTSSEDGSQPHGALPEHGNSVGPGSGVDSNVDRNSGDLVQGTLKTSTSEISLGVDKGLSMLSSPSSKSSSALHLTATVSPGGQVSTKPPLSGSNKPKKPLYDKGTRISARCMTARLETRSQWMDGKVIDVIKMHTGKASWRWVYTIHFDFGWRENGIKEEDVRPIPIAGSHTDPTSSLSSTAASSAAAVSHVSGVDRSPTPKIALRKLTADKVQGKLIFQSRLQNPHALLLPLDISTVV